MKSYVARLAVMAACATVAASAQAQTGDWGNLAIISSTMGNNANRICIGEGLRTTDIGCPSYAPSITTAGDVSVTGNLSANKFIGDGSLLTGVGQGDRIASGTTNVIATQDRSVTISTNGTQRVVIGENGKIGIGTASPYTLLDLSDASGATQTFRTQASMMADGVRLGGIRFDADDSNTNAVAYGASIEAFAGGPWADGGAGSSAYLTFATTPAFGTGTYAPIERMRIGASGLVGIGTQSPTATLQVSGSFIVSTSAQNTSPSLYVGSDGKVGIGMVPSYLLDVSGSSRMKSGLVIESNIGANPSSGAGGIDYNSATNDFRYWAFGTGQHLFLTSGAIRMAITNGGSIGVGTSSPGSSLTIVGEVQVGNSGASCVTATRAGAIRYTGGNLQYCNASNTWSTLGSAGAATAASNTGAIQFNVANALAGDTANLFWDDTNNRLGIGTSTPTAALEISGSGIVTGGFAPYLGVSNSVGMLQMGIATDNGLFLEPAIAGDVVLRGGGGLAGVGQNMVIGIRTPTGSIKFSTGTPGTTHTEKMRLSSAGYLGIGTTTPSATLTVSGSAIVSGTIQVAGAATETCTTGKLGTIRFNPVTGAPQICVQR